MAVGLSDGDQPLPTEKELAQNFKAKFEAQYTNSNDRCIEFQPLSYLSALEKAKAQMKLFFVYLHSPHHYNTPVCVAMRSGKHSFLFTHVCLLTHAQEFCRRFCGSTEALDYLHANFLCWGAR